MPLLPQKEAFYKYTAGCHKKAEIKHPYSDYKNIKENLEKNKALAWGVSFQNDNHTHLEHVRMTLHISEHSEAFILNRLQREGKGGVIRRIAPDTFTYEIAVFDANEMLPWIRTFIGRIITIESDCQRLNQLFQKDFAAMYHMYFKDSAIPQQATKD